MSHTVTIRTHLSSEWNCANDSTFADTWIVDADSNTVFLTLIGDDSNENIHQSFPPEAATSLGESLIRYAQMVKAK